MQARQHREAIPVDCQETSIQSCCRPCLPKQAAFPHYIKVHAIYKCAIAWMPRCRRSETPAVSTSGTRAHPTESPYSRRHLTAAQNKVSYWTFNALRRSHGELLSCVVSLQTQCEMTQKGHGAGL